MCSDPLIACTNLAKTYHLYPTPAARLKQMLLGRWTRFYTPFEALKPLSFTLAQGEAVGIIGRNGSGKSTLLQLIAGTLTPTSGTITVKGRVAALLELGAGFNPEFTGRENLRLNAAILGLSPAEITRLEPEILAFAGIGEFIDRAVATYSSGMVVRLAFAIATAARPEILIVDEALSVGDEAFQRKCFQRIEALRSEGTTLLFVSHSAQTVIQLCDRALWLDAGELKLDGSPKAVLDAYHKALHGEPQNAPMPDSACLMPSEAMHEYPPSGGRILNPRLTEDTGTPVTQMEYGKRYRFRYDLHLETAAENLRCGMLIKTRTGVEAAGSVLHLAEHGKPAVKAGETLTLDFAFTCRLFPGQYFLNCGVMAEVDGEERYLHRLVDAFLLPVVNPTKRNATGLEPAGLVDLEFAAMIR